MIRHAHALQADAEFLRRKRWGILPVLVWISTRDIRMARSANAEREAHAADTRLSSVKVLVELQALTCSIEHGPAMMDCGDELQQCLDTPLAAVFGDARKAVTENRDFWPRLSEAWKKHLAPAMAEGQITAIADAVTSDQTGYYTQSGITIPFADAPSAILRAELANEGKPRLRLPWSQFAHSRTEWCNVDFDAEQVRRLWPPFYEAGEGEDTGSQEAPVSEGDVTPEEMRTWLEGLEAAGHKFAKADLERERMEKALPGRRVAREPFRVELRRVTGRRPGRPRLDINSRS